MSLCFVLVLVLKSMSILPPAIVLYHDISGNLQSEPILVFDHRDSPLEKKPCTRSTRPSTETMASLRQVYRGSDIPLADRLPVLPVRKLSDLLQEFRKETVHPIMMYDRSFIQTNTSFPTRA